ncbi:hypothetical protein HZI63_01430 [Limosilactobacillus fermentum]|uniref:hypothetical protein n=1 Tax=Limosilactobacillus fermentum TaxID=1613 RepID=UPI001FCC485E|nr:hypothetical protein [Limosilactobacillus fermentum]MCJ2387580.1 hypothetical protein [Limosilactobacillus fermentum]
MHSYQKENFLDRYDQLSENEKMYIDGILTAVNSGKHSYYEKETALHQVNEMLFQKLVNDSND